MKRNVLKLIEEEVKKTQVLVFTGGLAKRMGMINRAKAMLELCGRPLIDWCIEYYSSCGFKDFIFLIGYRGEEIEEYIGSGERYGIKAVYVRDPAVDKVGKGKALKNAIEVGAVDTEKRALICFPDDIFLDETLPLKLLLHHIEGVKKRGILATVVFATAIEYPFGVGKLDENYMVIKFEEKPIIKISTSTGMYMLEPRAIKMIEELVDINAPFSIEFENVLLPRLAENRKLYALTIPRDTWIPINTIKELERAENLLRNSPKHYSRISLKTNL